MSNPLSPITHAGIERPAQASQNNASLFHIASLDDELNLLDESSSTEDLASALLASAVQQQSVQATQGEGRSVLPQAAAPAVPAASPGSSPGLPPPRLQIPGYQVGEAIAKGGMATVYKAVQISLNRAVAVKVLDPDLAKNPEGVARFRKEAAVLSALNHNSIVGVIDAGEAGGQIYLIMEYVPGTTLRYLLENVQVPMEKLINYVQQVLTALEYAHQKGVVHRDVKPENVIISRDHTVKLADFGIAGLTADAFGMDIAGLTQGLTKTSVALGTVNYIAPEQRKNAHNVGPPADIFSTGVVLYEILTGDVPVGAFDPPSKQNPNVPASFDAVVMKSLKNDPKERFQTAPEMKQAIQAALDQATSASNPAAPGQASSAPPPGGLAGLASGVSGPSPEAIAAAMAAAASPQQPRPKTAGGGRNRIDPEAAALLRKEQQRKEEEATWNAWQKGQEDAREFQDKANPRKAKKNMLFGGGGGGGGGAVGGGNLRQEVQRKLAKEVAQRDEKFRQEWQEKEKANTPSHWRHTFRQIQGLLGALVGILLLVAVMGKEADVPVLRSIPVLRSFCVQFRRVVGL
jgi:tRNA A-37 threonylcarbamoyl transferase component Bud32